MKKTLFFNPQQLTITLVYYNRQRVTTVNPGGWPPSIYREKTTAIKAAA